MTSVTDLPTLPGGFQPGDVLAAGRSGRAYSVPASSLVGIGVNVQAFGAKGDGIADDTAAFASAAAALVTAGGGAFCVPPASVGYVLSAPTALPSNSFVFGYGPKSLMIASAAWVPPAQSEFEFFTNVNRLASVITDSNIVIENVAFDYARLTVAPNGGRHAIRFRMARGIRVNLCYFNAGEDATAFLACDDTEVFGCRSLGATNCPYDHWDASQNARVIGCYAKPDPSCVQMVNFNGIYSSVLDALTSDGIVVSDNEFIGTGTGTSFTPINIYTLGVNAIVKNVIVSNNKLVGTPIIGVGNVQNVTVSGNLMSGNSGGDCMIRLNGDGTNPSNVTISGNQIIAPAVTASNLGVIRSTAPNTLVTGNRVTGGNYPVALYLDNGGISLVESTKATGGIGVVGVFIPEDPGAANELAKQGKMAFDFGAFWFKCQQIRTGQANVKAYNRRLRDLIHVGKAKPSCIISHRLGLDQAPDAYKHFDARDEGWTKVVLKPAA